MVHSPGRAPHALWNRVKLQLEKMVNSDIVESGEKPTEWVNSMVVIEKSDGSLRLDIGPRDLNRAIL